MNDVVETNAIPPYKPENDYNPIPWELKNFYQSVCLEQFKRTFNFYESHCVATNAVKYFKEFCDQQKQAFINERDKVVDTAPTTSLEDVIPF